MLYLSHEQTNKDFQLNLQMAVSLEDGDLKSTEKNWLEIKSF